MKNIALVLFLFLAVACTKPADTIIINAKVYTFSWDDPSVEGVPAPNAPFSDGKWSPDAQAVAIKDGNILAVGSNDEIEVFANNETQRIDAKNAVLLPGLIESHGHIQEIGERDLKVDLRGLDEANIIEKIYQKSLDAPMESWIISSGWDEGAFADNYPNMQALSEKVPDNPVILDGLRGFGTMGNDAAFEIAGITNNTPEPEGGRILKDENGNLINVLLNSAQDLLRQHVPGLTHEQRKDIILHSMMELAKSGFVCTHHAGVRSNYMKVYEDLHSENKLPIRLQAFIATKDGNRELVDEWIAKGPTTDYTSFLQVKTFKAYYDGSLGSRGAKMIEDYSDKPGYTGLSSKEYGFDSAKVKDVLDAGFQLAIHCIGDAGNRDILGFFERSFKSNPQSQKLRHRIEHAQIVHPDDFPKFGELGIIASMEPAHGVEDMPWAIDRVGSDRIKGGYAWRTMRRNDVTVIFNSDLASTDHDFFYGFHSAVTRKKRDVKNAKQWQPDQVFTAEETIRAYTIWPAYASREDSLTGTIEKGKWADLTLIDTDLLNTDPNDSEAILNGKALMTMVNGNVVYSQL